jgi:hypothetical protein
MRRSFEDVIEALEEQGVTITPEIIAQLKQAMSQGEGELGISDAEVGAVGYTNPRESFGQRNPREMFGNVPFLQGNRGAGDAVNRTNRSTGHDATMRRGVRPDPSMSGRTVEQANAEAQDPLHEFLLNKGILDSQGKAQPSSQERMRNQLPKQGTVPVKPVQRSSGGFNTVRSGTGDTEIPKPTGGFNSLRGGTGDTEIPSGVPEESSYWDDFTSFFSSEDDGMLSDKEKRRRKKVKSGRIAGGKGR